MAKRREPLVCQHIENLASEALEQYSRDIRQIVGRQHGVYALYRKGKLYYVGLASNLRSRLGHHLKDKHRGLWDRFSMYLTIDSRHMKELESLVLRIARPKGNKNRGRFARSQDLRRQLEQGLRAKHKAELAMLTGRAIQASPSPAVGVGPMRELAKWSSRALLIRVRFKRKLYWARSRRDGQIRFNGQLYPSPSAAAKAIRTKPTNGWTFWRYERAPGKWVVLDELRRR